MEKIYLTPSKYGQSEVVEKRSRFIGEIEHISSEQEALDFIKSIKKEYYDAKHTAYAYITEGIKRYSDDGEPAKTAGLPILEMLDAQKLTDCVCAVTRYFGGILLGTGGLVRAYTTAAKEALENAGIKKMTLHDKMLLVIPYSLFDNVKYIAGECGCEFLDCEYTDVITVNSICDVSVSDFFTEKITSAFGVAVKVKKLDQIYA